MPWDGMIEGQYYPLKDKRKKFNPTPRERRKREDEEILIL